MKTTDSKLKMITAKDLMVPLSEYATVSEDATLHEAVLALEDAQKNYDQSLYPHRAVLVYDKNDKSNIVGKLSQFDILKSLEPKYKDIEEPGTLARFGFSHKFLKSMMDQYSLWDEPLREICKRSATLNVKGFMHTPSEGEYVEEDAPLERAVHQLVIGRHQSLLVTKKDKITGVLRLTDVFKELTEMVKACANN
jgi:CBS domain-containing protein